VPEEDKIAGTHPSPDFRRFQHDLRADTAYVAKRDGESRPDLHVGIHVPDDASYGAGFDASASPTPSSRTDTYVCFFSAST
jgi:hypothetical protein